VTIGENAKVGENTNEQQSVDPNAPPTA